MPDPITTKREHDAFCNCWECRSGRSGIDEAEGIRIGRMTFTPAEGMSDAQVAKIVKQIEDAPAKDRREAAKYLKMPKLTALKKPSVEMLKLTGQNIDGYRLADGEKPALVIPEDARRPAVIELARKRYTAWLKDPKGDPEAAKYEPGKVRRALAKATTDQLVRIVESNIKPGAVVERKFAASLVECWDELARRSGQVAA